MRIVIKVGTSTLAHPTGRLNIQRIELLCKVMSDLKNAGHQIILVSSGAIAMGFGKLNLPERPKDVPTKQASAAVGQCELMYTYDKLFTEYNHTVAQLLITRPDITGGGQRRENFHVTLERLLELGALPIINENDTISTEEISIGDNDTLSAMVAASIRADLLILLSDIDGLYDSDPHKNPDARLIPVVERLDDHIRALAGGSGSSLGTGGMVTKLQAAQIATEAGCEMVIANGHCMTLRRVSRWAPAFWQGGKTYDHIGYPEKDTGGVAQHPQPGRRGKERSAAGHGGQPHGLRPRHSGGEPPGHGGGTGDHQRCDAGSAVSG